MKKLLLIPAIASLAVSCSPMYNASNKMMGATDSNLIKSVAFLTNCPENNVKIVGKLKKSSTFLYKVDACGTVKTYQQMGSNVVEVKDAE